MAQAPNKDQQDARRDALAAEKTLTLLDLARGGDEAAVACLYERYLPPLRRWARGRLPRWAREMRDTEDLVQESAIRTLKHLHTFQPQRDGAFHAFLRAVLKNLILDEIRHARRVPREVMATSWPDLAPSPLEEVIGRDALAHYEAALANLREDEREAVLARIELGLSYAEIASAVGKSSPDAARVMVSRALVKIARDMRRGS
jgi:RNA polymerase sigma-70 factor (ECF subfamily)